MKPVRQQIQELRRNSGVQVNGRRYVNYAAFMWYCRQSDHPHQLERKQQKYPAHFITVNEKPYVTEDYARYILQNQALLQQQEALLSTPGASATPASGGQQKGGAL